MSFPNLNPRTLIKASAVLAFLGLASRLAGLIRDRVLASQFGASDILDAYYVSFTIPNFIFNLIVIGALSSAFIPVFIEYQSNGNNKEWDLASNFLNVVLIIVALASVILLFFVPALANIVAPGFGDSQKEMVITFTRIMLLSPIIFSISTVIGSILQVFHRFVAYSLAPIFYNLGIIIGAIYLVPLFGPIGLAEGVVFGALLHLLVQLPSVYKIGFKWKKIIDFTSVGMRKIIRLMIPRSLGLAATQINWIVLTAIATTISAGSVAILNFANNLQAAPSAFIGISIAIASFPTLSREALAVDKTDFANRISLTLRKIIFIIIPISVLVIYLREDIVRIILGAGKFRLEDVKTTADVLGIFGIGIFAQAVIPFLSRSFYAMQDTVTPVVSAIISVVINILLAFLLFSILGKPLLALPLAFSVAGVVNLGLLFIFVYKKIPEVKIKKILHYLLTIFVISGIMLAIIIAFDVIIPLKFAISLMGALTHGTLITVVALLTYFIVSYILRIKESGLFK